MRVSKRNKLFNGGQRQIWIILVDFFQRRTKFSVLNDGVRENTRTTHDRPTRYLARDSFHQLAAGPIDIAFQVYNQIVLKFQDKLFRTQSDGPMRLCSQGKTRDSCLFNLMDRLASALLRPRHFPHQRNKRNQPRHQQCQV